MNEGIAALSITLQDWLANDEPIPEADWSKIRSLEFQETLQRRNLVRKRNIDRACQRCPEFSSHVGAGFILQKRS